MAGWYRNVRSRMFVRLYGGTMQGSVVGGVRLAFLRVAESLGAFGGNIDFAF